ncbi:hypothetical protein NXF25_007649 [Crotalus adamanteus]|uniref:Uncharacterized protein n=1 Tax=Crotalus adamanteus TaxID=8729 RepID=A0AAW1BNA2_CROAD
MSVVITKSEEGVVGRNLALRKPTYQSALTGGPPDKAVDGKCSGAWTKGSCTHTNCERNPWWKDNQPFGHPQEIEEG